MIQIEMTELKTVVLTALRSHLAVYYDSQKDKIIIDEKQIMDQLEYLLKVSGKEK